MFCPQCSSALIKLPAKLAGDPSEPGGVLWVCQSCRRSFEVTDPEPGPLDPELDWPEMGGVAFFIGVGLANNGQHERAIRFYQGYLESEPDRANQALALSNIGACLSALGRDEQAEAYHRRAIEAHAAHLGPRWNLFAYLFQRKRYADALAVVEQTMALLGLEPEEHQNMQAYRADILVALRRYDEALEAIDASLVGNRADPVRLEIRARILVQLRKYELAGVCIAQLLLFDPDRAVARQLLDEIGRRRPESSRN
jgi:tetratricopeptide (TPR) repeat protein